MDRRSFLAGCGVAVAGLLGWRPKAAPVGTLEYRGVSLKVQSCRVHKVLSVDADGYTVCQVNAVYLFGESSLPNDVMKQVFADLEPPDGFVCVLRRSEIDLADRRQAYYDMTFREQVRGDRKYS